MMRPDEVEPNIGSDPELHPGNGLLSSPDQHKSLPTYLGKELGGFAANPVRTTSEFNF